MGNEEYKVCDECGDEYDELLCYCLDCGAEYCEACMDELNNYCSCQIETIVRKEFAKK